MADASNEVSEEDAAPVVMAEGANAAAELTRDARMVSFIILILESGGIVRSDKL